jgi:hypothetical protein
MSSSTRQRLAIENVPVEINGTKGTENILLEFNTLGDDENRELIKRACLYFGGNGRWTSGISEIGFNNNQVFLKCVFDGSSSDPLGEGKNKDAFSVHELIKYIREGVVNSRNPKASVAPTKSILKRIVVGWNIEESGWLLQNIKWVDFDDPKIIGKK